MNDMSEFHVTEWRQSKLPEQSYSVSSSDFPCRRHGLTHCSTGQNGKAAMPDASIAKELTEKQNGPLLL